MVDQVVGLETVEVAFIELCTLRDEEPFGGQVVEVPALVVRWISNENALLHVRLQLLALVLLHKDVGCASKHPERAEIRLLAFPGFKGCLSRQCGHRKAVPHLDLGSKTVNPETRRQLGLVEHGSDVLQHDPVSSFCISILLRTI